MPCFWLLRHIGLPRRIGRPQRTHVRLLTSGTLLALLVAAALVIPPAVAAQGAQTTKDSKDAWDIIHILADASVPIIVAVGVFLLNKRQAEAQASRDREQESERQKQSAAQALQHDKEVAAEQERAIRELRAHEVDLANRLLPQLLSTDTLLPQASLELLSALGDDAFVNKVLTWHVSQLVRQNNRTALQRYEDSEYPNVARAARDAISRLFTPPQTATPAPATPELTLMKQDYRYQLTEVIGLSETVHFNDPEEHHGNFVETRLQHDVVIIHAFRVGVYPITNAFYLEFVQDGGYDKSAFWSGVGLRERASFLCLDRRTYGPSTWHSHDMIPDGRADHPVAGISYLEALAFCRWLQETYPPKTPDWRWYLPTEDMWELTARTAKGLMYPWGNEFREDCCNSAESNIGATTAVNTFPNGQSGYGCMDMAGNVWEFVRTADAPRQMCVLRGGSFRNNQFEVRSYLRLFRVPQSHRPPDFGFRCAQGPTAGEAAPLEDRRGRTAGGPFA